MSSSSMRRRTCPSILWRTCAMFSNLETSKDKPGDIVLVGQPESEEELSSTG